MIQLTFAQLKQNPSFGSALMKLRRCTTFSPKPSYWIGRILKKIEGEWKAADDMQYKIWLKYCQKDETTGRFVEEKGQLKLREDVSKEEFEKEMSEFWSISFTIPFNKLKLEDLEAVKEPGLTPDEIMAIEPLILHLEEVKGVQHGDQEKGTS